MVCCNKTTGSALECNGLVSGLALSALYRYSQWMTTVSRNDPCPCGSGKKYKHCHLGKTTKVKSPRFILPIVLALAGIGLGVFFTVNNGVGAGVSVGAGSLIIVGLFVLLRNPPPPGKGGDPGAINFGK